MPAGNEGSPALDTKGPAMIPVWPPIPGFYTMSLIRGGPLVPVRIWFGNAIIDGEEQDRGHDWRCEIDRRTDCIEKDEAHPEYRCLVAMPIDRAWPFCAKRPIDEATYKFMKAHADWAVENAPHLPDAKPRQKIDKRGQSVF